MIYLILGVLLWTGAHYFKRLMPEARAKLGERGKGLVTAGIVAGIILMIVGYRSADFIHVWSPPDFMVHVNNTLMLFAFWTFGSAAAKGAKVWPANKIRHPQLTSVKSGRWRICWSTVIWRRSFCLVACWDGRLVLLS